VPLPLAAERHYAYQQNVASAAVRGAQLAWSKVSLRDLDGSWRAVSGGLLALVTAAQVAAARDADPYLTQVLAEQGQTADAAGQVQPSAFAGVAADGRGLASLLESALVTVKVSLTAGTMAPERALASGGSSLEMLTATTVQDAGRDGVAAGIVARPAVKGYTRILTPPSCGRCAILAGRVYRWSTGFARHPRCDCRMLPSTDLAGLEEHTVDPMAAFRAGQVRGLSKAEEEAVRMGADLNQVVNAHREGAYAGMTTSEGVTKRGVAGKRLQGGQRLTVGAIMRLASDREQAIAWLERYGYLL
jgi:hypothetical protein